MEFKEFESKYLKLTKAHREIVFQSIGKFQEIREAQKKFDKRNKIKSDIRGNIKKYKKEMTYKELVSEVDKIMADTETMKDVSSEEGVMSVVKRNYQNSKYIKYIADVLKVREADLRKIENYEEKRINKLQKITNNTLDIKWLFESLSENSRSVIINLVNNLFMLERSPEIFDDDLYDE